MLSSWLDYQRVTLLLKCEGLADEQRKCRPVATSLLSLHGLVRHMADVEISWFQVVLGRRPDAGYLYWSDEEPDADLAPLDEADWQTDLAAWESACESSRRAAAARDLDDVGIDTGDGTQFDVSLRWIYNHMIEEYARHNGHADLIREMVDGAVGC